MARTQQSFVNERDVPIYISVEPVPECFELEPGEKLTLIYKAGWRGDTVQINFLNERELVIWLDERRDITFLINGEPAQDRSWKFKHK